MEGIVHVGLNVSVVILSTGRGQEGEQKDKSRLSLDCGEIMVYLSGGVLS